MARIKKKLSNWLNARHNLIIQNDENFSEKATYKFTYAKVIFFGMLIFLVILAFAFLLVNTGLKQFFDPRYAEQQTRRELVQMQLSLDSMGIELNQRDAYIQNIKRILSGDVQEELPERTRPQTTPRDENERLAEVDSSFKAEFETGGDFLVSAIDENLDLRQLYFFSPVEGYIASPYEPAIEHFGVDVVSKEDEPIKSIADGTVIFANWTQEDGYVIMVQHQENLISVYKHNSSLTKSIGDMVGAGDILAIIGNTGEQTTGTHLHFELWYEGAAVNPSEFISF